MNPEGLPRSVLVVGAGGREHALVRSLLASPSRPAVICAPGNAGIAADAECVAVRADDVTGLVRLARDRKVGFVVVGPEVPLTLGLADRLKEEGIPVYGPGAAGARLEASKTFTKRILLKYGIPTAGAGFFSETAPALDYLRSRRIPIVVKADGLAAGKGVVVASTPGEAESAVRGMLEGGKFGTGGSHILTTAQDHKRIGDGDTGPNTGGMGAYSPAEVVTPALLADIERSIVRPSVDAIAAEGIDFCGTLFIGIMLTSVGPSVLEFNTRFGDPETQAVLPRLRTDLLELLWAAARRRLAGFLLDVRPDPAICVVISARGYPEAYPTGDVIELPPSLAPGVSIYHAGTARDAAGRLVTAGGRVLGVTASAPGLREAAAKAYAACESVRCASKYYRRDIGARQLSRT